MKTDRIYPLDRNEETNIVDLEVIKGGKEPPEENWLRSLDPGTVFTCRIKPPKNVILSPTQKAFLGEYHVARHTEKCTYLLSNLNNDEWTCVHTLDFSRAFERIEIMEKATVDG